MLLMWFYYYSTERERNQSLDMLYFPSSVNQHSFRFATYMGYVSLRQGLNEEEGLDKVFLCFQCHIAPTLLRNHPQTGFDLQESTNMLRLVRHEKDPHSYSFF